MGGNGSKIERRNAFVTSPLNQPPGVVGQFPNWNPAMNATNWNPGMGAPIGFPMSSPIMNGPLMPMGTPLQAAGQFGGSLGTPLNNGFNAPINGGFGLPLNSGFGTPLNSGFGTPLGGLGPQFNNPQLGQFPNTQMAMPMSGGAFTAPINSSWTAPMPMTTSPQMQMACQPPQNVQYVPLQQLQHMATHSHCHTHPHSSYEMSSGEYVIPQQATNENQSSRRSAKAYSYTQTAVPRSA